MADLPAWPAWAIADTNKLSRADAREHLHSAQGFWRDFACAGLTLAEMREVIELRRRAGPGKRLTSSRPPVAARPKRGLNHPDHSLFESFPPLDPEDERWIHA
jgi:hypothetical protein